MINTLRISKENSNKDLLLSYRSHAPMVVLWNFLVIFPIPLLLPLLIGHVDFPINFVKSPDGAQMATFFLDGSPISFLESPHEMGLFINQLH